jgi:hypothetical protein
MIVNISWSYFEDIESALIFETKLIHNGIKLNSYSFTNEYQIYNTGYRGLIPEHIDMTKH